jgi:hypothetical protein
MVGNAPLFADERPTQHPEVATFGTLQSPNPADARKAAETWLKSAGKTDAESQKKFAAIWDDADRPLLDKVADTIVLGDAGAATLLAEARDTSKPAPLGVPAKLKDPATSIYVRANIAVAYAQALAQRKVYDEALLVLGAFKPEQTVDPSTYLFNRAVAEYSLMMKTEASTSTLRLLEDAIDAPERYRQVAALMRIDMSSWQDKDMAWISRKMGVIQNRLELTRGGDKTKKIQKEVLVRLDELIKEKENQAKNQSSGSPGEGQPNNGDCPSGGEGPGGPPQGNKPSGNGATESGLPSGVAKGEADAKKQAGKVEAFGSSSEKQRAEARAAALKELPPEYRDAVEAYLKTLVEQAEKQKK